MTLSRGDHVGFTVSDLDRSMAWYRRLLGAEPLAAGAVICAIRTGITIQLLEPAPAGS